MKTSIYYLCSISFLAITFYIAFYTHLSPVKEICFYIHLLFFILGFSEGYTLKNVVILLNYYAIITFIVAQFFELIIRLIRKDY
jgi:hypothetical protein